MMMSGTLLDISHRALDANLGATLPSQRHYLHFLEEESEVSEVRSFVPNRTACKPWSQQLLSSLSHSEALLSTDKARIKTGEKSAQTFISCMVTLSPDNNASKVSGFSLHMSLFYVQIYYCKPRLTSNLFEKLCMAVTYQATH